MFFAYIIKSVNGEYFYKGHCENLDKRIAQHNSGMTKSNKKYAPFELVYYEEFENKVEAISRERYFKSSAGRRFLKTKLIR